MYLVVFVRKNRYGGGMYLVVYVIMIVNIGEDSISW
jgi:hypothetical protein